MSLDDALRAGGSAYEWRCSIARAVEPIVDFGANGAGVIALAGEQPMVFPAPYFEAVIDAILARDGTAASPDEAMSKRYRERAGPDSPPSAGATTSEASNSRTGLTPGDSPPGFQRAARSARARSDATTVATVHTLPDRVDRASLARRAGSEFSGGGVSTGAPKVAVGDARAKQSRTLPTPADNGSVVASAIERIAEQLGKAPADRLLEAVRSVPRPGPPAPGTTLGRLLLEEHPLTGPATDSSPIEAEPPSGTSESIRTSAGHQPASDVARSGEPGLAPPSEQFAVAPRTINPVGGGPSDPPQPEGRDVTIVRHVSSHQELPPVPRRERSSAPSVPLEPDVGRPSSTSIAHGDDLEHRMKRILDEAARRHGIEV